MAVSKATLITRVRRLLDDDPMTDLDTAGVTSNGTSVTVSNSARYSVGDFIEWQDDGDVALITAIPNATTLTVRRSQKGATATAHNASTVIFKNPQWYYNDISDHLDRQIDALWPYAWKKVDLTAIVPAPTTTSWYNLASDFIDLIHVTQLYGASGTEVALYGAKGSGLSVLVEHNLPTALVASGKGIRFPNGFATTDYNVNVAYRAKITDTTSSGNYSDLDDGLLTEALVHLAAAQLVGYKEVRRTTQEDVSMGEQTVRPGERLTPSEWLRQKGINFRNQYHDYLLRTIPPMRHWQR